MKLEKTFRRNIFTALFIATLALANNVNAALVDLGGGMIYDSDQDITWLQDSNYTLHHSLGGHNGQMTWAQANAWAKTFTLNGNSGLAPSPWSHLEYLRTFNSECNRWRTV